MIEHLPTLLSAAGILVVGRIAGKFLDELVARIARRAGIGHYAEGTAMEGVKRNDGIARRLGKLVGYYVSPVALAIGVGVAFGLGGQDFVAENIDEMVGYDDSEAMLGMGVLEYAQAVEAAAEADD